MRVQRAALRDALHTLFVHAAGMAAMQMAPVLARLKKAFEPDEVNPEDVQALLDALEFGTWITITPEVERILVLIATDGAAEALRQVGIDALPAITAQVHEAAVAFAHDRAAELVGMQWDGDVLVANPDATWAITEGTRTLLRGDVTTALEEGWGTDELADHLATSYAFSDARAMNIARTELARADVEGNLEGWRASGVVAGKQSILSDSHDEEDECDDAAAMGVVDLDDDFGGLGDPPYHPRCECDVVPVLEDENAS